MTEEQKRYLLYFSEYVNRETLTQPDKHPEVGFWRNLMDEVGLPRAEFEERITKIRPTSVRHLVVKALEDSGELEASTKPSKPAKPNKPKPNSKGGK